jgi:hypothetical protein
VAFTLSEPARVLVRYDATGVWFRLGAGAARIDRRVRPALVRVRAWDDAGNRSALKRLSPG